MAPCCSSRPRLALQANGSKPPGERRGDDDVRRTVQPGIGDVHGVVDARERQAFALVKRGDHPGHRAVAVLSSLTAGQTATRCPDSGDMLPGP